MEEVLAVGFIGIFFFFVVFLGVLLAAVPLAILWEQDRYIFKDVPWWLMFVMVPSWLVVTMWQGLMHAD